MSQPLSSVVMRTAALPAAGIVSRPGWQNRPNSGLPWATRELRPERKPAARSCIRHAWGWARTRSKGCPDRPECTSGPLHRAWTQNVLRVHSIGRGFEAVASAEEQPSESAGFERRVALIVIQVDEIGGRHDYLAVHFRRGDAAVHSAPGHHGRIGRQAAFQDLVPPDQFLALGF